MKKLFVHLNAGDPLFIAGTDDMLFHIVHEDTIISTHDSLNAAISKASNEHVRTQCAGVMGWEALE